MALATITETLELPGGVVPTGTIASLRLIAAVGSNAAGYSAGGTVLWASTATVDTNGTYSFTDVRPNVGTGSDPITSPSGTVYELKILIPGATSKPQARYISVPDSAGPHNVADLLTIAPAPLPTGQDLLDLIDAAGLDLTDLPAGVTADGVIGLDGGALVELTPSQVMASHTGDTSDAHDASAISYAGGTGMSATDVESAIDELANEKANLSGAAFTGDVTVTGSGGGSLKLDTETGSDAAQLAAFGSGDTQPRLAVGYSVFDVPTISMGPGGSTPVDTTLYRSAAGVLNANGGGLAGVGKGVVFTEQSAPSSPAANDITLYAADNGSGTTVLRTKDSAGTVVTLGAGGGGSYTDEEAQDAVGGILVDGTTVDLTYNDGTPSITAEVTAGSLTNSHINASAAIALSKLAVDPLARANHTGTQAGTTVDAATTSVRGTVELATPAEARTGSSPSVVLTAEGGAAAAIDWSTPMAVGSYYPTSANSSINPLTVDRVYYVPISFRRACTLDRIGFTGLTAAVPSSVARLGIYTDTDGRPGALVVDAGTVSTAAGLSAKEIVISQAVDRGRYWLACVSQGGGWGPTLWQSLGYATGHLVSAATAADFNTGGMASGFYESGVSGALPATATPVALLAGVPVMIVRASA